MTREEAIWYLTPIAESASLERYKEALSMAVAALREQEERENQKTNASRIRSMSDQELAVFLCDHGGCSLKTCPGSELCNGSDGKANGILKWLQQPAEGE